MHSPAAAYGSGCTKQASWQRGQSTLFWLFPFYGGLCIYLQLQGFRPVVSFGNMATHHTGPPRGGFNKYYTNMKMRWTKGCRAADKSFLVRGVNPMASNAGPSFFSGDMKIVEVPLAIAEIGQGGKFLEKCLALLVALETKTIKLRVIGVVEFIRKAACPVFC